MSDQRGGMAVIGREIYIAIPARGGPPGVMAWVAVATPTTVNREGVWHAAPFENVKQSAERRRKTIDTACGQRGYASIGVATGDDRILAPWPPRVSDLPKKVRRCTECLTGHGYSQSLQPWDGLIGLGEPA